MLFKALKLIEGKLKHSNKDARKIFTVQEQDIHFVSGKAGV